MIVLRGSRLVAVLNTLMVISGLIDGVAAVGVLCFRWLTRAGGPRRRWPIQLPDLLAAGM